MAELFDIPLFEERDVYGGAVFMSTPGPLHPLGTMLQQVLNETGRILEQEGCQAGLGEWILRTVKAIPGGEAVTSRFVRIESCLLTRPGCSLEGPHAASQFIEKLAATFPVFADKAMYKGEEVLILKKAQLLASDLFRHMKVLRVPR